MLSHNACAIIYSLLQDQLFLKHLAAMFFHLIESPKAVDSASATFFLKLFLEKVCFEFNGHLKTVKKDAFGGTIWIE